MNAAELPNVEEMLEPQVVELYRAQVRELWGRLIRVHSSLECMRRIETYGLNEIVGPSGGSFWTLLLSNFGDSALMILATLIVDTQADTLNLPGFANRVVGWLKPQYVEPYKQVRRRAKFEEEHLAVKAKIDQVRDNHIAHVIWPRDPVDPKPAMVPISRTEIDLLFERVRKLFDVACLTHQHIIELSGYGRDFNGNPERAYIDDLLDAAARDSDVVRRPEQYGDKWPDRKKRMSPEHLERLRRWRQQLGLSEP